MILIFSTNTNRETVAYRSFQFLEFEVRGVRKVTTGEHHFVVAEPMAYYICLFGDKIYNLALVLT